MARLKKYCCVTFSITRSANWFCTLISSVLTRTQSCIIKVPLHFVNADVAPGVKLGGGIISHVLNEVDVKRCLPADLPEFIEVDLANLGAGQSIHMADLKLPKGVELVALHRGDNQTVANCSGKAGGEEAAE